MNLTGLEIVRRQLVTPASPVKVDDGIVPSWGPDPAGYTIRADVDWVRRPLMPFQSIKMLSLEEVAIPVNCVGLLYTKSTYARKGIVLVTNTPADGGYRGKLTIRLFNSGDEEVVLWGQGGFMQVVFGQAEGETIEYQGRWKQGEVLDTDLVAV